MTSTTAPKAIVIFWIFTLWFFGIICYLAVICIIQRDFFASLAHRQHELQITTKPVRAPIFDRHGIAIACNVTGSSAFLLPHKLEHPKETKKVLQQNFQAAAHRLASKKYKHFMYVKRRLTDEEISIVSGCNDLHLLDEPCRYYPFTCLSTVLGVTDIDNKGLFGLELIFDQRLAGKQSIQTIAKDARSSNWYFAKETIESGTCGKPITTTLDAHLQFKVYNKLEQFSAKFNAKQISALIMNPDNGEIIVMANYPAIDPNNLQQFSPEDANNRIITQTFELGSVIKAFAAMAALAEKDVTLDEPIDCQDKETGTIAGMTVNTTRQSVAGVIPFWQVIKKSNNIGIATVAQRTGTTLYDHYKRLGFGKKTGLGYLGEQAGHVTHPSTWSKRSLISLSFGYELRATLLQLARAFSVIVNGGYLVRPKLLLDAPTEKTGPLYDAQVLQDMHTLLLASGQTASLPGYTVLGKTGTANLLINGTYNKEINLYTFCGAIIKGSYKRVIVTFVNQIEQRGMLASRVALPLFKDIASLLVIHDREI